MKKILCFLLCLAVLLMGVGGYMLYQYKTLDNTAVPVMEINIGDSVMTQVKEDWKAPYFFGLLHKDIHKVIDSIENTIKIDNEKQTVTYSPQNANVTLTALYNGKAVFNGSAKDFNDNFVFSENGDYFISAIMQLETEKKGSGSAEFNAVINADIQRPIEYNISAEALKQGEMAVITLKNVPNDLVPTAQSDLGYVRFVKGKEKGEYKALVPIGYLRKEGDYAVNVAVGNETHDFNVQVTKEDFEVQNLQISQEIADDTVNSAAANWEFHNLIVPLYDTFSDEILWEGSFIQPVVARISTPYGVIRYINDDPVPTRHGGIDIAAGQGTTILAPNSGKVEFAGLLQLSGNTIVLDHGTGLKSYFYHMESVNVATGDMVEKGDEIGKVGTTGFSTGPHLHYEVKIGREAVNPWRLFDGTSQIFGTK